MNVPIIRLEVERMKYAIIHAFSQHSQEIEGVVERELERAIANYPFEEEIHQLSREVISSAIKEALEYYFKYGEGREVVKKAVIDRLDKLYD